MHANFFFFLTDAWEGGGAHTRYATHEGSVSLHGDICMQDILMRELYRPKYVQEYQTATSTPSLWMMATKMEILDGKESCLTKNVCVQVMWD